MTAHMVTPCPSGHINPTSLDDETTPIQYWPLQTVANPDGMPIEDIVLMGKITEARWQRAQHRLFALNIIGLYVPRLLGINPHTDAEVVQVAPQQYRHAGQCYMTLQAAFESR